MRTKNALKNDKETGASLWALELLISCLGELWEQALSMCGFFFFFFCMLLDMILEQIEKGICSQHV